MWYSVNKYSRQLFDFPSKRGKRDFPDKPFGCATPATFKIVGIRSKVEINSSRNPPSLSFAKPSLIFPIHNQRDTDTSLIRSSFSPQHIPTVISKVDNQVSSHLPDFFSTPKQIFNQ
ncbi:MAG: hypothetical protein CM1200mP29_01010 [Verrucomicrobiota bacterium]|nr:MAG: hypothetical protein CM1200mP29_01010 [Verrucomicrobiota bacterium]